MIRKISIFLSFFLFCTVCACSRPEIRPAAAEAERTDVQSEARETVTSEEIYRKAVGLLCNGDADYRQNKAAKELLEIIRGYEDSETYLNQIYEVCTSVAGERIRTGFVYDAYGHVQIERNNPYYETEEGGEIPYAVTYEYTDGKITREIYPNGSSVRYAYDAYGRIGQMETQYADGDSITYTYEYETDDEGKIVRRTAWLDGELSGERTSEYRVDEDRILTVLQHEELAQRTPSGKSWMLTFNRKGQLVRVDTEDHSILYTYGYVWMPEHDPDEEFVYEHRIRMLYF